MKQYSKYSTSPKSGFSLLELLAAVGLLMILVIVLAMVFRESNRGWALGTDQTQNSATGRAAINMIASDLQYAIADDVVKFCARRPKGSDHLKQTFGDVCDEICFVSVQHDSHDHERAARETIYYVQPSTETPDAKEEGRYVLYRAFRQADRSYDPDPGGQKSAWYDEGGRGAYGRAPLADGVASLRFFCADYTGEVVNDEPSDQQYQGYYSSDPANSNMLPAYVDVYLELLDQRAAKQLYDLKGRGVAVPGGEGNFVERNVKRYSKRVFFRNRHGYKPGRQALKEREN